MKRRATAPPRLIALALLLAGCGAPAATSSAASPSAFHLTISVDRAAAAMTAAAHAGPGTPDDLPDDHLDFCGAPAPDGVAIRRGQLADLSWAPANRLSFRLQVVIGATLRNECTATAVSGFNAYRNAVTPVQTGAWTGLRNRRVTQSLSAVDPRPDGGTVLNILAGGDVLYVVTVTARSASAADLAAAGTDADDLAVRLGDELLRAAG